LPTHDREWSCHEREPEPLHTARNQRRLGRAMRGPINPMCAARWLETLTEDLVQMMLEVRDVVLCDPLERGRLILADGAGNTR
jgi:gluconate kinase